MVLGIVLCIASATGIVFGIVKKNKGLLIASVILLGLTVAAGLTYLWLYSQNPY